MADYDRSHQAHVRLTDYNKRGPEVEKNITHRFLPSVKVKKKNSMGLPTDIEISGGGYFRTGVYKKPVQPVVYKKPDKSAEKLNYKKTVTKNTTKVTAPKATAKTKPVSTPVKKTKPVSTPVEKVKPVSKPVDTVTMKPTTQEEAKKLKEGFKKQTGREFKSQDSAYNKLEKKLGRKPTVAEYNKSLK
jgi:hypothetical protein